MNGPRYQMPRPLWVVLAEELPDGGVQLIASREVKSADLRMINKPWADDMHISSWGVPGDRQVTYHAVTPRLEIETRGYLTVRGVDLRQALEELYRRWRPTPEGDVNHT